MALYCNHFLDNQILCRDPRILLVETLFVVDFNFDLEVVETGHRENIAFMGVTSVGSITVLPIVAVIALTDVAVCSGLSTQMCIFTAYVALEDQKNDDGSNNSKRLNSTPKVPFDSMYSGYSKKGNSK